MLALMKKYEEEIHPQLMEKHGYRNILEVPRLSKILISTGISTAKSREVFDEAVQMLAAISGQKPIITKARFSVAGFKLREGQNVGVYVTLRRKKMYDFLNRLINIALPRVRDFRGIPPRSFDGFGNYTMGLVDQTTFTEVNLDKMKNTIGMNITIVTTAKTNEEAYDLLSMFGMPFANKQQ